MLNVIRDMDGLTSMPSGCILRQPLERTRFWRNGREVEQIVADIGNGIKRVAWCYTPFDHLVIEHDRGKPTYRVEVNWLHHCDFGNGVSMTMALAAVQVAFDEYQRSEEKVKADKEWPNLKHAETKKPQPAGRRVKLFRFNELEIIRLFSQCKGGNPWTSGLEILVSVPEGLPDDAVVLKVWQEEGPRWFGVLVEHPSFDEVPDGAYPPVGDKVVFRYLKMQVVDRNFIAYWPTVTDEDLDHMLDAITAEKVRRGLMPQIGGDVTVDKAAFLDQYNRWLAGEMGWLSNFERDVGHRVVEVTPGESWRGVPKVHESVERMIVEIEGITDGRQDAASQVCHQQDLNGDVICCGMKDGDSVSSVSQKVTCPKCREMM